VKKLNEYEDAYAYYDKDDAPDYTLKEAIKKFEKAAKKGYIDAYYDLSVLYSDNVEELGPSAYNDAFDYMKLAAESECESAYYQLAEMYLNKKYIIKVNDVDLTKTERIANAVQWYLKCDSYNDIKKINNCIDMVYKKKINDDISIREKYLEQLKNWYHEAKDEVIKNHIHKKEKDIIKSVYNEKLNRLEVEDDYNNLKVFLDSNNKIFNNRKIYDEYYLRYGNYKYDLISSVDEANIVLNLYECISDSFPSKKYCISKANYKIGMEMFMVDKISALKYFKKARSDSFKPKDLELINKFIDESLNEGADIAKEYVKSFYTIFSSNNDFKKKYKKNIDIIKFEDISEKAKKGDYKSQLTVANCYASGKVVEKNVGMALKCYMKIFSNHLDDESLTILYDYYKTYPAVLNAIKKYNQSFITKEMIDLLKSKDFFEFEEYLSNSNLAIKIDNDILSKI